ncbi:hypothetical protein [Rubrobacter aplysinae]|uniref:hypothetical protein n=1 Tax=Rubrobacter aplysinae TaxID=909625 RepID=UPI00064C0A95|nr:hypothetical protein [Rubrobacter aplysinae]
MEDWGRRFELLRDKYRREDGSKWSGAAIERATGGAVSGHFVSALARGKLQDPGIGKMYALSEVMGIPLEEWFEEKHGESWE